MYKNFKLTEKEKKQILESHMSHGYRQPLNEQSTAPNVTPKTLNENSEENALPLTQGFISFELNTDGSFDDIQAENENGDMVTLVMDSFKEFINALMNSVDINWGEFDQKHITDSEIEIDILKSGKVYVTQKIYDDYSEEETTNSGYTTDAPTVLYTSTKKSKIPLKGGRFGGF